MHNNEKLNEKSTPRRVGAVLDGAYPQMLDAVMAYQHRSFSDWLKRSIELDYRDTQRHQTTY